MLFRDVPSLLIIFVLTMPQPLRKGSLSLSLSLSLVLFFRPEGLGGEGGREEGRSEVGREVGGRSVRGQAHGDRAITRPNHERAQRGPGSSALSWVAGGEEQGDLALVSPSRALHLQTGSGC